MAHFQLAPAEIATAVTHRTVEEIWYILSGCGELWRQQGGRSETVLVHPTVSVTIPIGTLFQLRTLGDVPLCILGVTIPPWPGESEAVIVAGPWTPTAPRPSGHRRA